ncbi:hypothetical protein MLD38_029867 [Melastoma candidum]|uniref:Uncharacterized protein n=1 Tax=Melastoma candidum TaxID=119954 RepID=A0ACB9N589_9MYRT|nr:hypothetical protein MLD38_029867 [Melastoma candidum]
MGICWSNKMKAETPPSNAGVGSKYVSRDANSLSGGTGASSSSLPQTTSTEGEILRSSNLKNFTFNELKLATRNFRPDNFLGEDGSGSIFKAWIDERTLAAAKPGTSMIVAVKRINHDGLQGHREWQAEINYISQFHHPHLVKLLGFCLEDDHWLLVYEFMSRGRMGNHIFLSGTCFQPLSWSLRMKLALGAAKGLAFLHAVEPQIIYGDFNISNILLDVSYDAKLSDFRLARDGPTGKKSHASTCAMGIYGYTAPEYLATAPEYLATGRLTAKSDVYSFGVVFLEILSGRRAIDKNRPAGQHNLVEWAKPYLTNKRRIFQIIDNRLEGQYPHEQAQKAAGLALQCIALEPRVRPNMDKIVEALKQMQDTRG